MVVPFPLSYGLFSSLPVSTCTGYSGKRVDIGKLENIPYESGKGTTTLKAPLTQLTFPAALTYSVLAMRCSFFLGPGSSLLVL